MNQRVLLVLVMLLAATTIGLALFWQPQIAPPANGQPGGDFVLDGTQGRYDTRQLRGKLVLIYFGYTYCPDICPTSLAAISQALEQLSPGELAQVQTLFVSVDPDRDTPDRLKSYVAFFHPSIVGLVGSDAEVAGAARIWGAIYARQDVGGAASYVVDHSAWIYLLGADGHAAGRIAHGASPTEIAAEIRRRLPAPATSATKGKP